MKSPRFGGLTPRFNPWWGCARVSEACQHCYAEEWAKRFGTDWGKTAERRFFGDNHWNEPLRWNRAAEKAGTPRLVFCASMADVFEDRDDLVPHRDRLWELIGRTPWLTWQLLTKRPENIVGMVPWSGDWPVNVWVGTTVETQRWADERIPHLLNGAKGARVRFLSCEPLFESVNLGLPVDHRGHERDFILTDVYPQCLDCSTDDLVVDWTYPDGPQIDWVITGGESGPKARPSHPAWFRSLRDQCQTAGVPYLFKQWGEWLPMNGHREYMTLGTGHREWQKVGGDLAEGGEIMVNVGKKIAGHVLDGRTWDEIPKPVPACR